MATIASLNVALSADSARLKRDLDKAGKSTQSFANKQKQRFKGMTSGVKGLGAAMAGMAAVMGTKQLLTNADALGKNAAAAGIGVEAYQRLQFGFGQAGISQAGFEKGSRKLNKVMLDAGDGLKTSVEMLAKVGLSYEDLQAMAPEDRMVAVANALNSIDDAGTRAAVAAELLGKEMATVPLNGDAIKADGEKISVVNAEAASSAAKMNDAMAQVSITIQSLLTNAVVPLMASLAPVIETISELSTENPMMVGVIAGVTALALAFATVSLPVLAIVAAVAAAIAIFHNWDAIVRSVDSFMTDNLGVSFGDIAEKLKPISDILMTLGGLMFDNLREMWNIITAIFTGDFEGLKTSLMNIFSNIGEAFGVVLKAPLNAAISAIESIINGVMAKVEGMVNGIPLLGLDVSFGRLDLPHFAKGGHVSGEGSGTSDDIQAMLSNGEFVVTAQATAKYGTILEAMNNGSFKMVNSGNSGDSGDSDTSGGGGGSDDSIGEGLLDTIQASFSTALQDGDWKSFLESTMDSFTSTVIDNFAEGLFSPLDDFLGGAIDSLMNSLNGSDGGGGIWGSLMTIGSSLFGGFGAADGGIVPTTPFSKSYADSVPTMLQPGELVVPVDQVGNFMSGGSGGGGQTFNINVSGDVSRQTRKEIVAMMPQIASGTNQLNKENGIR